MKTALLLIAHGSRNAEANADLDLLAESVRATGRYALVVTSYLELAEPTIDAAAHHCVAEGSERVILMPYFLSAGVHVRRDLQAQRDRLRSDHPTVDWRLAEPLGQHPKLCEIVLQRAGESERDAP